MCRAGLAQHPAYLSARITLGRALLEMGRYDEAASEFDYVLKAAPDNLTAVRELADIEQRKRSAPATASAPAESAPGPDPVLAELEAWLSVLTEERAARVAGV